MGKSKKVKDWFANREKIILPAMLLSGSSFLIAGLLEIPYIHSKWVENTTGYTCPSIVREGEDKTCPGTLCRRYSLSDTQMFSRNEEFTYLTVCTYGYVSISRISSEMTNGAFVTDVEKETTHVVNYRATRLDLDSICFHDTHRFKSLDCTNLDRGLTNSCTPKETVKRDSQCLTRKAEGLTPRFKQAQIDYREQLRRFKPYILPKK